MLIRHTAYYVFARGLPGIVNFLAISVYTRILSPGGYGLYAIVMAWVGLVNVVFFQWIRLSLLRFFPSNDERPGVFLATILYAYAAAVAATGLVGLIFLVASDDPQVTRLLLLVVPLTWAQAWFELSLELARSQLKPVRYGLLSGVKAITSLGLGVLLVLWGFGAHGALVGLLAGMLISSGVFGLKLWKEARIRAPFCVAMRPFLSYGIPLTATFALAYVVSSSDRLILAWLMNANVAGVYSAGYDLVTQVILLLLLTVNLAAYPLVVRALEKVGREAAEDQLAKNGTLLVMIALPVALGFVLLAQQIVALLLGEPFRKGVVELIPWVAAAAFLEGVRAYHFDLAFQLGRKTLCQVWIAAAAALINVVLNILLIPPFGMLGAAYATVGAYFAALILSAMWGRRFFSMSLLTRDTLKVSLSGVLMIGTLWTIRDLSGTGALVFQVAVGATSYFASIILLNVANIRDHLATKLHLKGQF